MFYVLLDSSVASSFDRSAGIIQFRLPNSLFFSSSNWIVSITELSIPPPENIKNIGPHNDLWCKNSSGEWLNFYIPKLHLNTIQQLLEILSNFKHFNCTLNDRGFVEIRCNHALLPKRFASVLGVEPEIVSYTCGNSAPNIFAEIGSILYITSDLVQTQLTSGTYTRLLKVASIHSGYHEVLNARPCHLDVHQVSTITIELKNSDNKPVEFISGDIMLSLLFQEVL